MHRTEDMQRSFHQQMLHPEDVHLQFKDQIVLPQNALSSGQWPAQWVEGI
jgi:hypothetical protein